MTEEELKADKKRRQHEAYRRWYLSEKGQAYKQKAKEKRHAVKEPETQS